jgi:Spy/CpxP family protein refolding chaperone
MKRNLMTVLSGAVLLTAAATPFVLKSVQAQPGQGQQLLAQLQLPQGQGLGQRLGQGQGLGQGPQGILANLNLTSDQQARMRELQKDTRKQIEAVLTPTQREQYRTALQNRMRGLRDSNTNLNSSSMPRGGQQNMLTSLNLSQSQKSQIAQIMQLSRRQMDNILTDSQRAQLQQMQGSQFNRNGQGSQWNPNMQGSQWNPNGQGSQWNPNR